MVNGFNGKILFVDLTSGSIKEEKVSEKIYREYLGGQGLGVRILYERMKADADPLGPDNILGFTSGPLAGTGFSGSRFYVVAKSPITGGWGDAAGGGFFGAELKASGYDGVFFTGQSSKLVYLYINDGKAELKDASHLKGKDTTDTTDIIRDELGDDKIRVACIGLPGELKSFLAAVMEVGSAAARSGVAAVMGSKNLKAVAVRGKAKMAPSDPAKFNDLRKTYVKYSMESDHPFATMFRTTGTPGDFDGTIAQAALPIKNWQLVGVEGFPNWEKIGSASTLKYQKKRYHCQSCPLGCKGVAEVPDGPYAQGEVFKVQYETLAMLGSDCLVDNVEAIYKANEICNRQGIDTISVGAVIAFAMELYDRGIITKEDTGGIELKWGDADVMITMVEKICKREGFGAVLADGSKFAAEKIGKGAEKYAMQSGGQDIPAHDGRGQIGYGWGYACDPTPGKHTVGLTSVSALFSVPFSAYADLSIQIKDMLDHKANGPIYANASCYQRLWECCGLCAFGVWPGASLMEVLSALTGWDFTFKEGMEVGHRIQSLRQAFNIRHGAKPVEWNMPERLSVAQETGPNKGIALDYTEMKKEGWKALGWDPDTGMPLDETIEKLGLKELVV